MPTIPQLVLAVIMALVGAGAGALAGRVIPLFRPYGPAVDADASDLGGSGADTPAPAPRGPQAPAPADPGTDHPDHPGRVGAQDPAAAPAGPPPPTCPHCAAEVPWPKWAPLPGRFVLRGRCPSCAVPVRAPVTAAVLAAALMAAVVLTGADRGPAEIAALCFFALWTVLLGVVDARVKRLPNRLLFPAYPIALALLGAAALTTDGGGARLVQALIGMACLALFYFVLWLIYPAGMGWGDVKAAGLLGLYLGWETLGALVSGTFIAFLASSVFGLTLIALGRATRKSEIPLGPFLLLGTFAVILFGDPTPLVLG